MTTQPQVSLAESFQMPPTEARWYAAYTRARHEKRVAEQLQRRSVEHFLPLCQVVHRWKNGRHQVQLPLFPGYVFVHIALQDRMRVLQVPGLVRLVGSRGLPTSLPPHEIDAIREAVRCGLAAESYPYLRAGTRVQICRGPLQGITGFLLRRHGATRVVVSVDPIMRSIVVDVDAADVVPLSAARPLRA